MTVCEYIRDEYFKYEENPEKYSFRFGDPKGSFEYFHNFCRYICDGGFDYQLKKAGISQEQLDKAVSEKYMKKKSYTSWEARMKGQTLAYWLTEKGIRTIYKWMKAE